MLKWKIGLLCGYPLLKWVLKSLVLNSLHSLRCSSTKVSPAQLCQGSRGWCWLCWAGMGKVPAPAMPLAPRLLLGQVQLTAAQGWGWSSSASPIWVRSCTPGGPVLFAGYHMHLSWNCSLPPPFYQPSVASAFHGSFTDVTADLLCKIFLPIYLCLCFIVTGFFYISFYLILFKYFSIHLSFMNASINNQMKELSNIIPGY